MDTDTLAALGVSGTKRAEDGTPPAPDSYPNLRSAASSVVSFGRFIKVAAIVVGVVLAVGAMIASASIRYSEDRVWVVLSFLGAGLSFGWYGFGVLLCAIGEAAFAVADTASATTKLVELEQGK